MKRLFAVVVFVAIAVVFGAIGCKRKEESEGKYRIGVIPKGTTHVFWKSIHAGAVKAERELNDSGLDVEVIWKGPLKEDDRESQIRVVEDFITRGVSGIVLAPLDDAALRMPVRDAVNNGIPVVIIDSGLNSGDYASFVATDNYIGGKKGGERLGEVLGGKGKVIMLRCHEGSASSTKREQGFLDVLEKKYPEIDVVSSNQYGGATTESAYIASENLLAPLRKPDGGLTIDGIFCPNESTSFGMLRALEDSGLAGQVNFVGFDSSEAHLGGRTVENRIDTGSVVATPENMDEPKIKNLLESDFRKWLNE
ncbi:MAG: substrate-binding domain-containing protein [Planctomycetota bacterium]|jgi:ribose transport system substrate-binding protein